jgi:hypothetical protein
VDEERELVAVGHATDEHALHAESLGDCCDRGFLGAGLQIFGVGDLVSVRRHQALEQERAHVARVLPLDRADRDGLLFSERRLLLREYGPSRKGRGGRRIRERSDEHREPDDEKTPRRSPHGANVSRYCARWPEARSVKTYAVVEAPWDDSAA